MSFHCGLPETVTEMLFGIDRASNMDDVGSSSNFPCGISTLGVFFLLLPPQLYTAPFVG